MTVGESLTEARYQAGLSIDELSERTRIRDTVIRSIEQDDYEACGGDLYVRGYVRTIAGAVGIDAQPLIREYDQERVHAASSAGDVDDVGRASGARPYVPPAAVAADPSGPPGGDPDATSMDLPAVPPASAAEGGQDPDETRFDLPAVRDDPTVTRFDLPPVRADHTEDMMAAAMNCSPRPNRRLGDGSGAAGWLGHLTAGPHPLPAPQAPAASPRPGAAAAVLLAGVAAVARAGHRRRRRRPPGVRAPRRARNAADSTPRRPGRRHGRRRRPRRPPRPHRHRYARAPRRPRPRWRRDRTRASRSRVLPVAAAYAFGPDGLGDGDNPQGASYTIARNPPLPWSTNWYATAQFGLLKHGTGLLLSLGRQETITSVLVDLTQYRGVNLQLKVGDGTAPEDFRVAATADDTGGAVRLTFPHPASARYLLIWFTQLPPNGAGQYQESVYHVLVNGRR